MKVNKYNEVINELKAIITNTEWENHIFTVGGCNRDFLMGNPIKDIDLVVDLPDGGINFAKWLYKNGYGSKPVTYENFGTAMFRLEKFSDVELEIVQTRSECYHDAKSRNPETSFGTLKEDWQRRDFTINAIYYNISKDEFIDFENRGQDDIKNKIIRTCGDPNVIFEEDSLRIFRMVRFAARFKNFKIEDETYQCAKNFRDRLSIISRERITDEFKKLMEHSYYSIIKSLSLMWDLELFKWIIPEFENISTYDRYCILDDITRMGRQIGLGFTSVLTKLLYEAIQIYREKYPECGFSNNDLIKYYLRDCFIFSNDVINKVTLLINENEKLQKIFYDDDFEEDVRVAVRKIMNKCGDSNTFYLAIGIGDRTIADYFLERDYNGNTEFEEYDEYEKKFYTYKLPITGEDVMEIFGIGPGKKVKEVLNKTLNFVFVNPSKSSKEDCIDFVKYLKQLDDEWGKY